METHFVGLDLAAVTGYADINLDMQTIFVCEVTSQAKNYEDKVLEIYDNILDEIVQFEKLFIGIEQFVYFAKSRVTQAQLAGFYGFMYHSLRYKGFTVASIHIATARKMIRPIDIKNNKKAVQGYLNEVFSATMTNNETDALTVAISLLPAETEWKSFELIRG